MARRVPPVIALLISLALFAVACSGSSPADPNTAEEDDTSTGDGGDGVDVEEVGAGGLGVEAIPERASDPLVYSCAGRIVAGDSLIAALGSDPPAADALTQAGFDAASLGDLDAWRLLDDADLLVSSEPLDTEPAGLVLAEPGGSPFGCVATRAIGFDLRQVAFEPLDGGLAIESCVDPESVTVDRRTVGDSEVISVFAPASGEPATSCAVDGSSVVGIDAAGGEVLAGSLTSFTFPFSEATPAVWHRLGFVSSPTSLDGTTIDTSALTSVECAASSLAGEVFVEWTDVVPGFNVTVVADDQDLFQVEFVGLDGSPTLARAAQGYVEGAGGVVVDPPVAGFLNGFSDYAAPLEPRGYALRIDGGGSDPVFVDCGEAGLTGEAPTPQITNPTTPVIPLGGDLAAAKATFEEAAVSPFAYLRIVPICGGCGAAPIDLQMSPSSGSSGVSHLFDPVLSEQAGSAASAIVNPFEIHDVLAQAEDDGRDVQYTLDPLSGLPTRWTIDGVGGEILCFEVDTAPPDLRPGQVCETTRDLMSS